MDIRLIHGEALTEMSKMEDASIDMVLAGMPYGTLACAWDQRIPFEPMWEQVWRVLKPSGVVCFYGSEPFSSELRVSQLKRYKYDWVWNKVTGANFLNLRNRPFKTHENIMVFSRVAQFTFNPIRVPRTAASYKRHKGGGSVYPVQSY